MEAMMTRGGEISRRTALTCGGAAALALVAVDWAWRPTKTSTVQGGAYLTTDIAVPPIDADDYYDVACAIALGFAGIVIDKPTDQSVAAVEKLGGKVVEPRALSQATSIVVVGAATNAARYGRAASRIVMFAGDATGGPEHNVDLDPEAYAILEPDAYLVPCADGGIWTASERTSFLTTDDHVLLAGAPSRWWFEEYIPIGPRNLWGGALLSFAFADTWRGQSVAGKRFRGTVDMREEVIAGTRALLAKLPGEPVHLS